MVSEQSGPAQAAAARARSLAGTGKCATSISEISTAAETGAVDQLVIAQTLTNGGERRGRLDDTRAQLSTALNHSLANGAGAHLVDDGELPVGSVAAAVLRY